LKKQKCGGFLFKIFEYESLIRSTNVALAGNSRAGAAITIQSYIGCACTLLWGFCSPFFFGTFIYNAEKRHR